VGPRPCLIVLERALYYNTLALWAAVCCVGHCLRQHRQRAHQRRNYTPAVRRCLPAGACAGLGWLARLPGGGVL